MTKPFTYDILLPTGKQVNGITPAALRKAIEEKKIPEGTQARDSRKITWGPLKLPAPVVASVEEAAPPPPTTRMMYPLPPDAPPGVKVFAAEGERFVIERDEVELCTVSSWDAVLRILDQLAPPPQVVQPVYYQQPGRYEDNNPRNFQQTHIVVHQAPSRSGSAIGVLVEIFLVPLTGYILGGLGVAIAGKGVSSLIGGMVLWFVGMMVIFFTGGLGIFIVGPIIFLKWIIDIIYCVN